MNAFDQFASQHARKEQPRRAPKAPETRLEKQQVEDHALMKRYHRLIREEREHAYSRIGGEDALKVWLWAKRMTLDDGDTLIIKVRRLCPARLDKLLRHRLLSDLNEAIERLRIRSGMHPFDDPMMGEADNVSRVLKEMLG